ncbi:MAG: HAD-IA family hydrolase [Cyanobacteria bacterium P01_A01_bin.105]
MDTLKAIIFDVDGTLAETERDGHRVAFNRAFQAAGLPWRWSIEEYGKLLAISGGKERIRHYIETVRPSGFETSDLAGFVKALHQSKGKFYLELIGSIPLRPGVRRLIDEARTAGVRLAIATTSSLPSTLALLTTVLGPDSPNWFDIIAAGDVVPYKKPSPGIYYHALTHLDLPASQCIAIEDTHHGLVAATRAGLRTLVTVNDYTLNQDFRLAKAVINHLGEPNHPLELLVGDLPNQWFKLEDAACLLAAA